MNKKTIAVLSRVFASAAEKEAGENNEVIKQEILILKEDVAFLKKEVEDIKELLVMGGFEL